MRQRDAAGIDGAATAATTVAAAAAAAAAAARQAPANDATLEGAGVGDCGSLAGGGCGGPSRNGGAGSVEAARALRGAGEVLDETWDTAESPNFAAALQASFVCFRRSSWSSACWNFCVVSCFFLCRSDSVQLRDPFLFSPVHPRQRPRERPPGLALFEPMGRPPGVIFFCLIPNRHRYWHRRIRTVFFVAVVLLAPCASSIYLLSCAG